MFQVLQIPTISKGVCDSDKFKFNVESNVTMQGQQGRFECLQISFGRYLRSIELCLDKLSSCEQAQMEMGNFGVGAQH